MINSLIFISILLPFSVIFAANGGVGFEVSSQRATAEDIHLYWAYFPSTEIDLFNSDCHFVAVVTVPTGYLLNALVKMTLSSKNSSSIVMRLNQVVNVSGYYDTYLARCTRTGLYDIKTVVTTTSMSCILTSNNSCESIPSGLSRSVDFGSISVIDNRKPLTGDFIKDLTIVVYDGMANITWTDTWEKSTVDSLSLRYLPLQTSSRNVRLWEKSTLLQEVEVSSKNSRRSLWLDFSNLMESNFTIALRAEDSCGNVEMSDPGSVYIFQSATIKTSVETSDYPVPTPDYPVSTNSPMAIATSTLEMTKNTATNSVAAFNSTANITCNWLRAIYIHPNYIKIEFRN